MKELRKQFPVLSNYTYLNTARYCALPQTTIDTQHEFIKHVGTHGSWDFARWSDIYERTRVLTAELIGCGTESTFFLPNVSLGFNLAAQYLPKRKVICLKNDFPSVNITWEPHGFEVRYLDYTSEDFNEQLTTALKEPNQILSVSWIQAFDGFEIDLEQIFRLCKEKKHILILDGTQGLGAIPFRIDRDVDCLFLASGFKWMMAGYGIAAGYASSNILKILKPLRGWNSGVFGSGSIYEGAKSLEVGNATYLNAAALFAGLTLIKETGIDAIYEHNTELKNRLIATLKKTNRSYRDFSSRSSILSVCATDQECDILVSSNIQVTKQSESIRVSPHFYNSIEDINKLLSALNPL